MKILFDQGTPVPLRRHLHPHSVDTLAELGWSTLTNGNLLAAAVREGYDVLVTTDQNLTHQQNLSPLDLGIVVLLSTSWPRMHNRVGDILAAINSTVKGQQTEVLV